MKKLSSLIYLILFSSLPVLSQVKPGLWTEYVSNPNAHPNIPNCSYAGYRYGDEALPSGTGKIYNVKNAPYGAKGDQSADDTEAIRKAIKDAENAGGGIVYLPDGHYTCSGVLFINGDNVILRGESQDNTVIHFTKSLTDGYAPNYTGGANLDQIIWSWAGGNIWITPRSKNTYLDSKPANLIDEWLAGNDTYKAAKEAWNTKEQIARVTSTEDRGAFSFTVDNPSQIKPGDYIAIRYKNPADWSLMKYFAGDGTFAANYTWGSGTGWISPQNRPYVDWVVQVDGVEGNKVTLRQPLRVPLRAQWEPVIMSMGDLIKESGVENLTIELEKDYESDYGNSNWRNANHNKEKGWNGIYVNNAVNCFARNVTVYDAEMGAGTAASKNITFSGIKIHGKDKKKSAHHGLTCRVQSQDILFENFELLNYDQFDHGINVEDFSMGNVWHAGIVNKGCFDTHKLIPAECIRTNIKVDVGGGYGGSGEAGPQIGTRFVHWNVEIKGATNNTITPATTMPMGAIVGITGDRPSSSSASGCIVEACNIGVTPADLYVGQKELRNNKIQPESKLTPWTVWSPPCRIEAEDAKLCQINIDDDSFDDGSGLYLHSFNNPDRFAEYDVSIPVSGRYKFQFRVSSEDGGENYLSIKEKGVEIGSITFNGSGRGNWRTIDTEILLNPGEHTLQLYGLKGMTCLNYFKIDSASETSMTPFPQFETLPGKYNGFVTVALIEPEDTDLYYRIEGESTTFNNYTGPFELDRSATITVRARKNGVWSLNNSATFEIIPPLQIPCKFLAIEYSDQEGMGEQFIDGSNNQLTVGQAGDWAAYFVTAPKAGKYQVNTRISIKLRDGLTSTGFDLYVNGEKAASFPNLPDMGGNWDRFKVYPAIVELKQGVNEIKVVALNRRFNFDFFEIFSADPVALPSEEGEETTIEVENYSPESTGYGLHVAIDTSKGRQNGYEVEVSPSAKLYYPVKSDVAGYYDITFMGCPRNTKPTGVLTIKESGQEIAQYSMESVSNSSDQREVTVKSCYVTPGKYTFCLSQSSGGTYKMDKMVFKLTEIDSANISSFLTTEEQIQLEAYTIQVSFPEARQFTITDMGGCIVSKGKCSSSEPVDISRLSDGVYIFTTETNQQLRFIK